MPKKRKNSSLFVLPLLALLVSLVSSDTVVAEPTAEPARTQRTAWWSDARLGMFIHWGLYALPAGEWKGEQQDAYSEWLMYHARIPVREYESLAKNFKPDGFNAREWVQLAKSAGMKYIVITAKHHDGFSMFDSKVTDYDIVDATPFGRDPMKELAKACREEGIKLCFYYSVDRDWHHPDAQGNHLEQSNSWDYPDEEQKDFDRYFDEFVMPQLTELLSNYGPVGILWFDGIGKKTPKQNEQILTLIRQIQPECLVNSRLGDWMSYEWGDYRSMDDNEVSDRELGYGWENPGTLNSTYGYSKHDDEWRSSADVIQMLADIASKGGNYLLNVGPTAKGLIQPEAKEILDELGAWMKTNSESIYGSEAGTIGRPRWGRCTTKPGTIYLHVFDWPRSGKLDVAAVKGEVTKAYLLADPTQSVLNYQAAAGGLTIELPGEAPDPAESVVVLEVTAP